MRSLVLRHWLRRHSTRSWSRRGTMSKNDDLENTLRECRRIIADYEALDAEVRLEVDRRLKESGDLEVLSEIIHRVADGSMPKEEAERWLSTITQQLGKPKRRN